MEINLIREMISEERVFEGPAFNPESLFRKIIRWLVYGAVFLMPLWFLPFAADGLEFDKQVLLITVASAGLILYLIDIMKVGLFRHRKSVFYWPLIGLVGAGIFSVIFSVSRFASIFGADGRRSFSLASIISLAVIFFLAVNTIEDKGQKLANILKAALILSFVFFVLQIFGVFILKGDFAKNAFNTIGTLNTIGILAALGLVLFVPPSNNRAGKFLRYPGLLLSLFILTLINWWVVWTVAFLVMLAFVALNSSAKHQQGGRMKLFAVPMAVIVLGVFLMLINFNWASLKNKFPVEVAPTFSTSLKIAKSALIFRPLGYGLENFPIAYDKFKPVDIVNTVFYQIRFDDATSAFISLAVEGGILMLAAFLCLVWFYGRGFILKIKNATDNDNQFNWASSVWAAGLGVFAAFFLYPANTTLMSVFIFILVLASLSSEREDKVFNLESHAKYSFAGSAAFIAGLVLVLAGLYFTATNYIANIYLARALLNTDRTKSVNLFVKSINSNGNDARTYRLLSQTIVVQLGDELKNGPDKNEIRENYSAKIQNQINSAITIAQQATTIEPANAENWSNLGFIYQNLVGLVSGADQAAVSMYGESLKRNSADPVAYLRIGTVYSAVAGSLQRTLNNPPKDQTTSPDPALVKKQINDALIKAEENFKKAIGLYNNFGPALYNLAVAYDQEGRLPEAIKQFEKLQVANPRDPSIVFQLGLLYYRNGQKDGALKAWQQAVLLSPNYSNARWYLSLIYEERGDLAGALAQVEEIQKLNPDDQTVKQRLEQLKAGKRTIPPDKLLSKQPLEK